MTAEYVAPAKHLMISMCGAFNVNATVGSVAFDSFNPSCPSLFLPNTITWNDTILPKTYFSCVLKDAFKKTVGSTSEGASEQIFSMDLDEKKICLSHHFRQLSP